MSSYFELRLWNSKFAICISLNDSIRKLQTVTPDKPNLSRHIEVLRCLVIHRHHQPIKVPTAGA
jgi:hypothetical protein